jgi:hypothetical protein
MKCLTLHSSLQGICKIFLTFSSPRDFWSNRWNRLFSHCFHRIIFRFRPKGALSLTSSAFAMAVFTFSGVLHGIVLF